jgi:hypothetical protein
VTPRDVLVAARALIARPEAWTKGAFARAADGTRLYVGERRRRRSRCAAGAYLAAGGETDDAGYMALCAAMGGVWAVSDFNDAETTTHADVLAAFDRAIAAADGAS